MTFWSLHQTRRPFSSRVFSLRGALVSAQGILATILAPTCRGSIGGPAAAAAAAAAAPDILCNRVLGQIELVASRSSDGYFWVRARAVDLLTATGIDKTGNAPPDYLKRPYYTSWSGEDEC
ncbi:uncharacterized protein LY79DRAFT_577077 [Colletotrichum navitas]|uniref:Uncharacterized protein n=1 Tax=Colletotrichum navitas TaxID=681940 RepID=A0AAD8Q783_9PEZI|nr:uncharacterized protein LY79DRAFT_577077 [Colletotrichum navitas]KAK1596949.1 hypothetical protein LY79DRAFT_577077 [Colletotrichum navitas]